MGRLYPNQKKTTGGRLYPAKDSGKGSFVLPEVAKVGVKDVLKEVPGVAYETLLSYEKGFGESIGQSVYQIFGGGKEVEKISETYLKSGNDLLTLAKKQTDPQRKQKLLKMAKDQFDKSGKDYKEILPYIDKSNAQIAGEAIGVLTDILSAGTYGVAAKGAKTGQLLSKTATVLPKTVTSAGKAFLYGAGEKAVEGTITGGAYGLSSALQEKKPAGEVVKQTVTSAVASGVLSAITGGLSRKAEFNQPQVVQKLRDKAIEQYKKGLNATKEKYKEQTNKVIPQLLDEKWWGTRKKLLQRATAGEKLGEEQYKALGELKGVAETTGIMKAIDKEIARYTSPSGRVISVNQAKVSALNDLKADIMAIDTLDNLADFKASQEGLRKLVANYGQELYETRKSQKTIMDNKTLSQVKKVDSAIRVLLAEKNPDYAAINKPYHLATELAGILHETAIRKEGKAIVTLPRILTALTGVSAGAGTGSVSKGIIFGLGTLALAEIVNSTWWNTLRAVQRNALANKLAQKSGQELSNILLMLAKQGVKYANQIMAE